MSGEYRYVRYETEDGGRIAIISLDRPRQRNAQNRGLLVELDDAFMRAERDDDVRVVILRGEGSVFSSGHDLGSSDARAELEPGPNRNPTFDMNGGTRLGSERRWIQESHYYFENTKRWRDLRKITIASVQGPVIAGGLMLMWACDLIVAAEDATFVDVVGARLGMAGVEYFAHPWELGARRTKELLLTGDSIDAEEGYRIGMVSKVFPTERLDEETLAFARRIAAVPTMAALMIKQAVNQTQDNQGFHNALAAVFSIHALNHAHWAEVNEDGMAIGTEASGLPNWREAGPVLPSRKDTVRATVES
jgi:enoyl-CoA hydratase